MGRPAKGSTIGAADRDCGTTPPGGSGRRSFGYGSNNGLGERADRFGTSRGVFLAHRVAA